MSKDVYRDFTAILLAGGEGKRLGLKDKPKPMVIVVNRPVLEKGVARLKEVGFNRNSTVCVVGHKSEAVINHFGNKLIYAYQPQIDGNASAIKHGVAAIERPPDNILVVQGDDCEFLSSKVLRNLMECHIARESEITILLTPHVDESTHTVGVEISNNKEILRIKPRMECDEQSRYYAGVFVFSKPIIEGDLFRRLEQETPEGLELGIGKLIRIAIKEQRSVYGIDSSDPWVALNTPRGIDLARNISRV